MSFRKVRIIYTYNPPGELGKKPKPQTRKRRGTEKVGEGKLGQG